MSCTLRKRLGLARIYKIQSRANRRWEDLRVRLGERPGQICRQGTLQGYLNGRTVDHVGSNYGVREYTLNRCSELGIPLS